MVLKAFQKFHPITPDLKPGCNTKSPGGRRDDLECAPRCSAHIQRKNYFYFAILENLRIFQNCLFTGGVVEGNGICSAAFCESAALWGERPRPLRQFASLTATSPKGRGLGMAGKLPAKAQSLRACSLPWGELSSVARLRGFKSAEPEKTVKRSSRRTGVNLQFFPVEPTPLGLKGASSPFFVAPARRNRWWFSGSLLPPKENIPRLPPPALRRTLFCHTKSPGGRCGRRGFSEIWGLSVHSLL